jgi:hypothetical protein
MKRSGTETDAETTPALRMSLTYAEVWSAACCENHSSTIPPKAVSRNAFLKVNGAIRSPLNAARVALATVAVKLHFSPSSWISHCDPQSDG